MLQGVWAFGYQFGQTLSKLVLLILQGVHCIAFSPLGHSDPGVINNDVMGEVAQELGRTSAQVRLRPHVDFLRHFFGLPTHFSNSNACQEGS